MIIMHVTYLLKPTAVREEFCRALEREKILDKTRAEDGCRTYQLFYPVDAENQVFLLEIWETAETMAAHKGTDQCRELQEIKKKFVENTSFQQFEF